MGQLNKFSIMQKIRELRLQKGYSQKELAERAGIEHAMLNKYEKGKAYPTLKTLEKISSALDFTVSQIICLEDEGISSDELLACAQPLIELLQKKGNPMMVVHVTDEGADLYAALCGTEKRPRED